jgi:hypothetical protein
VLALAVTVAIVTHGPTPLAASTEENAARQATLWRGDWLEVRGERQGRLKVYDYRHERPGYVAPSQVRVYTLNEASAPALRAVIDFLRDEPGAESLGIGYVALYLKVAPAAAIGPEILDALGTMAERLARRASRGGAADELEVAQSYGVKFASLEGETAVRVCYDGEAFRRVLLSPAASSDARARAALGLTDPACGAHDEEAALDLLGRAAGAAPVLAHRLRLRRAGLLATLAWLRARRGDAEGAARASNQALDAFAGVERTELAVEDGAAWQETALRVAAARWLREPAVASAREARLRLDLVPGETGETCVRLLEGKVARLEKCTHGLVFAQSVRRGPHDASVAIAVQLLPGWVEQWVFRKAGGPREAAPSGGRSKAEPPEDGFIVDPVPPADNDPELGYTEIAGFSPDGKRLLVAREARVGGNLRRSFEVRLMTTLAVEHNARNPELLWAFGRWTAPEWKHGTVALR